MSLSNSTSLPQRSRFGVRELVLCSIFAALMAVGAFIRVPLPLIPFTLQVPIMALSGMLLGAKKALLAQSVYLLVGLVGFPVFTEGGGLGYFLKPTFGYLLGFLLGAFIIGKVMEMKKNYSPISIFIACIVGIGAVYLIGIPYVYFITTLHLHGEMSFWETSRDALLLFIPKDLVLCFLSAFLAARLLPVLKKSGLIA